MPDKEERIKSITKIYYSNPKLQEFFFNFARNREVVPSYMMQSFGKRPDSFQYPSDIMAAVRKGATSFHASEELWKDPLQLSSDFSQVELSSLRKSWDLLIDVDSPFLDYSKIATKLLVKALEKHRVKNYAMKFSGSKGFHIIVPSKAFPAEFKSNSTKDMFPGWPRAICEYLMNYIKPEYNKIVKSLGVNYQAIKERTNLSKEDILEILCPNCSNKVEKTNLVTFKCDRCGTPYIKPNYKLTQKKLKCTRESCPGYFVVMKEEEYFLCKKCSYSSLDKTAFQTSNITIHTAKAKQSKNPEQVKEEISGEALGSLDLVLVAPRHLFRMPYSLHEKTALASVVLGKEEIDNFSPQDANPFKIKLRSFYPDANPGEAELLLETALNWKSSRETEKEKEFVKKYSSTSKIDVSNVPESLFPKPIIKLLNGLQEGRKRGLFILLTFLRSLNFSPDYIIKKIHDWNKLNSPPLKDGYVKSQIDWHLKQKKMILPPNYSNLNFYKDLNILDSDYKEKNPVSEVLKRIRKK